MSQAKGMSTFARRMLRTRVVQVLVTAAAFALFNRIGYYFQIDGGVSVFYPATAIDVVACMLFGIPGAIGVFLGCLLTPWQAHETLVQTSISGLLNVAEGMIPYVVFRTRRTLFRDLHDFRSLVAFVLFGCAINSAVSAGIGNLLLTPPATSERLFIWWVSDFSAALLLALPILAFAGVFLERWFGLPEETPHRTLKNAVAITGTIVVLGWAATTAIQTYLGEHIENVRDDMHAHWRDATRSVALANGNRADVKSKLIAIDDDDERNSRTYEAIRERCELVTIVMQSILLLIILLASANVICRIAQPLHQMHDGVVALRKGEPFDSARVTSNLVELRLLADTIEETTSELRAREEALREQTARAVAASKTKSEFLAKMSHELRTPLNSIIGFSELMLERGEETPPAKRESFLQNVVRSAKHLLRLINDLLDMAKIEAGKMEFRYERADVRDIVRSAVAAVMPLARTKEQSVDVAMPEEPVIARVDPVRIEQVLLNLLSNANKFSREGTRIEVVLRVSRDDCEIDVRDHGIGIREEDQSLIFEDFTQLHTVPRAPGTGLGLGLAKRFVDAQGGTLSVASRAGEGSTFTIRLPLERTESVVA